VGGRVLGKGEGKSKKISEQEAAKLALLELQQGDGEKTLAPRRHGGHEGADD
jgi:hypothetical protein